MAPPGPINMLVFCANFPINCRSRPSFSQKRHLRAHSPHARGVRHPKLSSRRTPRPSSRMAPLPTHKRQHNRSRIHNQVIFHRIHFRSILRVQQSLQPHYPGRHLVTLLDPLLRQLHSVPNQ